MTNPQTTVRQTLHPALRDALRLALAGLWERGSYVDSTDKTRHLEEESEAGIAWLTIVQWMDSPPQRCGGCLVAEGLDKAEAERDELLAALRLISSESVQIGEGAYYAAETSNYWVVDGDDLADLCDYLDDDELLAALREILQKTDDAPRSSLAADVTIAARAALAKAKGGAR